MIDAPSASKPGKPCPTCRKPAIHEFRPFCSKRCADIDLNRWFSGAYAIPGAAAEDEETQGDGLEARRRPSDEEK